MQRSAFVCWMISGIELRRKWLDRILSNTMRRQQLRAVPISYAVAPGSSNLTESYLTDHSTREVV